MTRRERMEQRAERREEWAQSAKANAAQKFNAADRAIEMIPFGQPILVGHHSEGMHRRALARCDANMRKGIEMTDKATRHEQVAETLRDRLDSTIFSDDDNATQALRARIEEREAERARIVAYNATCRKAAKAGEKFGDLSILDDKQKSKLLGIARVCPYQMREGGAFPAYELSNLSGRIKADRDRLASIEKQNARKAEAESNGGVTIQRFNDWCRVTFAEKPERAILDALKAAGFRWSGGSWCGDTANLPQGIE